MPTDFFDRQDYARRQTRRLLVMFGASVVAIILAVYFLAVAVAANVEPEEMLSPHGWAEQPFDASRHSLEPSASGRGSLWNPPLFFGVAVGMSLVIAAGSLYKIAELASGGETVALMLGGRAVSPQTRDPAERRLLNVVEEMALASGVPVPPVYVLDNERGINAFAAGHQPGDAVVAVSAGGLKYLNREELQGVIGHEFSHILNGDMRLNLRLIGVVHGILVLAIIGYYLMRSAGHVSSRNSKNSGGALAVLMIGLALFILGYLGVFLGKIIKSAISRQREYLADASSVQFTRNPGGLAGALKKIGGLEEGSRIRDEHAEEVSHMFFGDAFAGSFFNLFATHPPLVDRIRALEPNFDGRFPKTRLGDEATAAIAEKPFSAGGRGSLDRFGKFGRMAGGAAVLPAGFPAALPVGLTLSAADVVNRVGRPLTEGAEQVGRMIDNIPKPLLEAAREPFVVQAVVYAVLLSRDAAIRARQEQMLQAKLEPAMLEELRRMAEALPSLAAEARLPLVDLAVPALKQMSQGQYVRFREMVEGLVGADDDIDAFEHCLCLVLFSYLDVHFGLKKPAAIRYRSIGAVVQPASVVLSLLAYRGHANETDARRAFQAAFLDLQREAALLPREQCTLKAFDAALAELNQAAFPVKRRIIAALTVCIAADGRVTLEESELLRAVAAALGCPLPPIRGELEPIMAEAAR